MNNTFTQLNISIRENRLAAFAVRQNNAGTATIDSLRCVICI